MYHLIKLILLGIKLIILGIGTSNRSIILYTAWHYQFSSLTTPSLSSPGQPLATTVQGTNDDVDLAVKSSRKAYESWSKTPPHVRARYMYRLVSEYYT